MLLSPPPHITAYFLIGVWAALAVGGIFSSRTIWNKCFPRGGYEIYKKQGEYGEYERYPKPWSPFQEPLNAWTSLAYLIFGCVILCTGVNDLYDTSKPPNHLAAAPGFSILYGVSGIYLGISSFLFHASHAETWRKADAGMTSGVVLSPLIFALWDRLRPPAGNQSWMVGVALLLQLSLTHGYLPYGSSDILLPSLVGIAWIVELLPRYGGPVDDGQYSLWGQCFYTCIVGMLLRLADIKRGNPTFLHWVLRICIGISLYPFGWYLGLSNPVILCGIGAWFLVNYDVTLGHIWWHFGSAYSLFIWWYMLRIRPGNQYFTDAVLSDMPIVTVLLFIGVKNAVRRIFMALPFPSCDHRDRVFLLLDHTIYAIWGYIAVVAIPEDRSPGSSWMLTPILCWSSPPFPLDSFYLYFLAKVASHIEDLGMLVTRNILNRQKKVEEDDSYVSSNIDKKNIPSPVDRTDSSVAMHHMVSAALCMGSWFTGYSRIASLVMVLHDISDVPLDIARVAAIAGWNLVQNLFLGASILSWAYWRLWFFVTVVLYTIAFESKSLHNSSSCDPGSCTWTSVPERVPFLLLLGVLVILHATWLYKLGRKFYVEVNRYIAR